MRLLPLLLYCISTTTLLAHDWFGVNSFGGKSYEQFTCIESDAFGNIYVGGNYDDDFNLGSSKLTSKGGIDGFVAKFDRDFKLLWVVELNNSDSVFVKDLDLDGKGNLFVGGHYKSKFDVSQGSKTTSFSNTKNNQGSDIYALKIDSSGNLVEGFVANVSISNGLNEIYYSNNGAVYAAGYLSDALKKKDGLLMATSLNKQKSWKQTVEGVGDEEFVSVVQHQGGDILALTTIKSSADFDNGSVTKTATGSALALGIYTSSGMYKDVVIRDEGEPLARKMLIEKDEILIGGTHTGALEKHDSLSNDPFILGLIYNDSTRTLTYRWSNYVDANDACTVTSMCIASKGTEVVLAGQFTGELKSITDTIPFTELDNSYTATFSRKSGKALVRLLATGSDDAQDFATGMAPYRDGLLLCGAFKDTVNFGDTSSISKGNYDGYIAFFDELELYLRPDSASVCRDSAQLDSASISIAMSGPFDKGNEFRFEVSESKDFKSFSTQLVSKEEHTGRLYLQDTLGYKKYYVRLASTKPRLFSPELRIFHISTRPIKPTISGPDTITAKDTVFYSSGNLDPDRKRSHCWSYGLGYSIIGDRTDSTIGIVFTSEGQTQVLNRTYSEHCYSETAIKKMVVGPEHSLSIHPRGAHKCEGDTMQWKLYTRGHFKPSNKFILIADTSKGQSPPIIVDTVKWKPNLFGDNQIFVFDLSPLPPGEFNIMLTSTEPLKSSFNGTHHYGPVVTINPQPSRPEIDGSTEVILSKIYTYTVKSDSNSKYLWSISNGSIVSGQESGSVDVEWLGGSQNNGELRVYRQLGACKSEEDTLVVDIVSSIKPIIEGIGIYPNPAHDRVFIKLPGKGELTVFTVDGRIALETIELSSGENSVDLSALKPGTYMIHLLTKNGSQTLLWQIE